MANIDNLRNAIVNEFYDNTIMLNVALNIEQFLCDDVMLYPYKNWFKGELVAGPYLKKYYVIVVLRYDLHDMPDPEGGKVLQRFNCKVFYKKNRQKVLDEEKSKKEGKKVAKDEISWLVKLVIPRHLVSDENQMKNLDIIDEIIDTETLEDASEESSEFGDRDDFAGGQSDFGSDFGSPPAPDLDFDEPETAEPEEEPDE